MIIIIPSHLIPGYFSDNGIPGIATVKRLSQTAMVCKHFTPELEPDDGSGLVTGHCIISSA